MKRKGLFVTFVLLTTMVLSMRGAQAQVVNPLATGALGAALGYAAGRNAASAAIGGAAGIGAGILLNAPAAAGGYGYYRPVYPVPIYPPQLYAVPAYPRPVYGVPVYGCGPRYHACYRPPVHYHPHRVWSTGYYNRFGAWIPGHWR